LLDDQREPIGQVIAGAAVNQDFEPDFQRLRGALCQHDLRCAGRGVPEGGHPRETGNNIPQHLKSLCAQFWGQDGQIGGGDQFVRLRDAIEERASRKFFEGPVEAKGPVVLRSNDFFK
jgi:hypothetical protein